MESEGKKPEGIRNRDSLRKLIGDTIDAADSTTNIPDKTTLENRANTLSQIIGNREELESGVPQEEMAHHPLEELQKAEFRVIRNILRQLKDLGKR